MADDRTPQVSDTPRKRPKTSRKSEQHKKQRLSQHTVGPDCRCSRFKCFQNIAEDERQVLIGRFNGLASKNEQDSYLSSCISVASVARRRPREESANQVPNESSFAYKVLVPRGDTAEDVQVCTKALGSIFGVSEKCLRRIKEQLSRRKTTFNLCCDLTSIM